MQGCLPAGPGEGQHEGLSLGRALAGGKEGRKKETPARVAVAVKSGGLWDMVRCWRGVVQQQVGCGAVSASGAHSGPTAG